MLYLTIIAYKTITMLRRYDLQYLIMISNDPLAKSMLEKIYLVRNNCIIITFYVFLYIVGNFILCFYLKPYMNAPLMLVYNQYIDSIALLLVIYNLRGRRLLTQFDGIDIMYNDFQSIYTTTIKESEFSSFAYEERFINLALSKRDKALAIESPIVIINPNFVKHSSKADEARERINSSVSSFATTENSGFNLMGSVAIGENISWASSLD